MGVYIKGLEMPKKGEHIIALIKNDGKVSYFEQDTETTTCKRMKEAEAIKIPTPHGRLIDRDAVPEVSADPFEEAGFQGVLDDMPVFLEAEGRS